MFFRNRKDKTKIEHHLDNVSKDNGMLNHPNFHFLVPNIKVFLPPIDMVKQ
jgi:hypothetical protein